MCTRVRSAPDPQLAVAVVAPADNAPVARQRAGVPRAGGDGDGEDACGANAFW